MKILRRVFLLIALYCLLAGTVLPAFARPEASDFAAVDDYITETMRRVPIAGLSLAIVKGDQILYLQGYGTANQAGDPVTPQTPFMLASVTKTFTALAVQQLVADGRLDLDAPLQTIIPEFALAGEVSSSTVTIRHLLDHTSGISTLEGSQPYLHSPETTFDEALTHLARYAPRHAPGEHYEYSNWNYVLLGEVIGRLSGHPYAGYMQAHILDPLEMSHASFADYHTLPGAATGNLIVFCARVPYDEKHIPVMLSAGYLTASAEDMAHYLIPFFNQGQYHNRSLLPAVEQGWYGPIWNWQPGRPGDISYGYSGAHNSINTAIQLFSLHKVGVAVLMNTRLDSIVPAPTASDIAFNIARLVIDFPYELPSNQSFTLYYALLDGFLLLAVGSIVWQASRLPAWARGCRSASIRKRVVSWMVITVNLLVTIIILALPTLLGSQWRVILYHRPEIAVPFLAVSLCLGALGLVKLALNTVLAQPLPIRSRTLSLHR